MTQEKDDYTRTEDIEFGNVVTLTQIALNILHHSSWIMPEQSFEVRQLLEATRAAALKAMPQANNDSKWFVAEYLHNIKRMKED